MKLLPEFLNKTKKLVVVVEAEILIERKNYELATEM